MYVIGDHIKDDSPDRVNGQLMSKGYVERDYSVQPQGKTFAAVNFKTIPRAEWSERIKDREKAQSTVQSVRRTALKGNPIPSLDQNGEGYCWFYSCTMSVMLLRAIMGLPYVRLSAHSGACKIKNFRNEGAWAALAYDWICKNGIATVTDWPEKSMNRAHDVPKTWENAAAFKITEGWVETDQQVWDRNLNFEQEITLLLQSNPHPEDYNHWGHSVCIMDAVDGREQRFTVRADSGKQLTLEEFELMWGMNDPVTGGIGKLGINSWTDNYGDMGEFVLTGSKAISNGAVAPLVVTGA